MRLRADAVLAMRSSITTLRAKRLPGLEIPGPSGGRRGFTHRPNASQDCRSLNGSRLSHIFYGFANWGAAQLGFLLWFYVDGNHQVTHLRLKRVLDPVADG